MISKHLLLFFEAVSLLLPVSNTHAQTQFTFEIVSTYDYPGSAGTSPGGLNDLGDVVGGYTNNQFYSNGFIRFHNGFFSAPIINPNDNNHSTVLRSINNLSTICGTYGTGNANDHLHGFLLSGTNNFIPLDVAGAVDTLVNGINDAGDVCGSFSDGVHPFAAFVKINGIQEAFSIANDTSANGINNLNQVVGSYVGGEKRSHGFVRDPNGNLTFPIRVRGASSTVLFGINDQGRMVGLTTDATGKEHGLFFPSSNGKANGTSFDFPGAVNTGFIGINSHGIISGFYTDAAGFSHAFLARVRPGL